MIVVSSCPVDADRPPVARHADATGAHVRHEGHAEGRAPSESDGGSLEPVDPATATFRFRGEAMTKS